jgi:hypothetical protein
MKKMNSPGASSSSDSTFGMKEISAAVSFGNLGQSYRRMVGLSILADVKDS